MTREKSIIQLPNLSRYRSTMLDRGLLLPLSVVEVPPNGLLDVLPLTDASKNGWPWTTQTSMRVYATDVIWPKITIVTPSYNQGTFLEQTIRSVLLQNYPNLEYIVIDGGSTDNSVDIIKRYSPWISYWQSGRDSGQSQAINVGFSIASGAYYAWINSDDYYAEGVFKQVVTAFQKTQPEFVYGYGRNEHVKNGHIDLIRIQRLFDVFIRIPTLFQPSCFWVKEIHRPIWEELQCALDYELWLRMLKGKKKKLLKFPLSTAHVHSAAKTHGGGMDEAWRNDNQLICSKHAHGPVYHWDVMVRINNLYLKTLHFIEKLGFN